VFARGDCGDGVFVGFVFGVVVCLYRWVLVCACVLGVCMCGVDASWREVVCSFWSL